jgi:hypothetical protein
VGATHGTWGHIYGPNTKRQDAGKQGCGKQGCGKQGCGKQGWLLQAHLPRTTDQDMIHKRVGVFIGIQSRET